MITKNFKDQTAEYFGQKTVVAVYKGLCLVWQLIKSCFGKGYWINEAPWINDDGWKNNI